MVQLIPNYPIQQPWINKLKLERDSFYVLISNLIIVYVYNNNYVKVL